MRIRSLTVAGIALALASPLVASAQAGPLAPQAPPHASYFAEAQSGFYNERYDDYGSDVMVIDRKWLLLEYYGTTPDGEDTTLSLYFGTRGGSRFYLTGCDGDNNAAAPIRVSRKTFMDRVANTPEREVEFTYDAERDSGVFVVTTGYFVNGEGLYSCPGLPPQD